MFKVDSKDTKKTTLIVQCLHMSDAIVVALLLTSKYFTPCSSVSIVDFEQANRGWKKYL